MARRGNRKEGASLLLHSLVFRIEAIPFLTDHPYFISLKQHVKNTKY